MAMNPALRELLDLVDKEGGEVLDITCKKHYKISVCRKGFPQKHRFFVAPTTPGDRRSFLNTRSVIRRVLLSLA